MGGDNGLQGESAAFDALRRSVQSRLRSDEYGRHALATGRAESLIDNLGSDTECHQFVFRALFLFLAVRKPKPSQMSFMISLRDSVALTYEVSRQLGLAISRTSIRKVQQDVVRESHPELVVSERNRLC